MILFDLDGTLVDTAPDLGLALNIQRQRHGLTALAQSTIRPVASHGSRGLLALGFNLTPDHAEFSVMREEYLALYSEVFTKSPMLFAGITELLAGLDDKNIPWGIVTNKPRRFSEPLLEVIKLDKRSVCLVCGDDAPRAKPYPDTLLMASEQAKVNPASCIYVGDAERDVQAGIAAGMRTVVALYGYIADTDEPQDWGADYLIEEPAEIMNLLQH